MKNRNISFKILMYLIFEILRWSNISSIFCLISNYHFISREILREYSNHLYIPIQMIHLYTGAPDTDNLSLLILTCNSSKKAGYIHSNLMTVYHSRSFPELWPIPMNECSLKETLFLDSTRVELQHTIHQWKNVWFPELFQSLPDSSRYHLPLQDQGQVGIVATYG